MSPLLAVPNVSEGRDAGAIAAIVAAATAEFVPPARDGFKAGRVRVLDIHTDPDHNRTVITLTAGPGELAAALTAIAAAAIERIDVRHHEGVHPRVGAIDVAPIVFTTPEDRGAACAEALLAADRLADELNLPVFLYGLLTDGLRTRAEVRRGGIEALAARIVAGELTPDFGPRRLHETAGAVLVAARPPLVAFNLQLAPPADVQDARRVAALIREGGEHGLPGVRAIGIALGGDVAQVSMNVERPFETPLASVLAAVRAHADVVSAELVGLAPAAALEGFPGDIPLAGFDPARHLIENALGSC